MIRCLPVACLFVWLPPVFGQDTDVVGSADHPLITRFPGSVIIGYGMEEFDRFELPLGKATTRDSFESTRIVEGRSTRIAYRIGDDHSTLEILRSYETALAEAGFEILYQCHTERECGNWFSFAFTNTIDPPPVFPGEVVDEAGERYVAARRADAAGDAYAVIFTYPAYTRDFVITRLQVIEVKSMTPGLVHVDAAAIGRELQESGHVALYGIYFETDSTVITPESEATLTEMAKFLMENREVDAFVVGHTDATGTLAHNMDLSRRRAEAVVEAMTARYGVAPQRLTARGVGPLSPVASNDTESGRSQNRRVELVRR